MLLSLYKRRKADTSPLQMNRIQRGVTKRKKKKSPLAQFSVILSAVSWGSFHMVKSNCHRVEVLLLFQTKTDVALAWGKKKKSLPENHKDLWDYRIGTPIQLIDQGKLNTVPPKESELLLCGAPALSSLEQGQFQGPPENRGLITAPSVHTEVRRWSQSLHSCAWWEG